MSAALCYSKCQVSPAPIDTCVCGCRGALHGIRSSQLTLLAIVGPVLPPTVVEQLPLELRRGKRKGSAAAEAEDEQGKAQETGEQPPPEGSPS
jgi:hypothetical protein